MQKPASNNFFLIDRFSLKGFAKLHSQPGYGRLYQHFGVELSKSVISNETLNEMGNKLVAMAEHAYALRQMDAVEQASQLLLSLPLSGRYKGMGKYYLALSLKRKGEDDKAIPLLEDIAVYELPPHRARALQTLGVVSQERGDYETAVRFYLEALKCASPNAERDPLALLRARLNLSAIKSDMGDHKGALDDLAALWPLAQATSTDHPMYFYGHYNDLAYELLRLDRIEEARNASRIALASPFAKAYPEWRETGEEIAMKQRRSSRSVVSFTNNVFGANNIVSLSTRERESDIGPTKSRIYRPQQKARILDFQEWKNRMTKESDKPPRDQMPAREMLLRIMDLISEKGLTDDQLQRIMLAVEEIALESDQESTDKDR